jgi:hypothetical protein
MRFATTKTLRLVLLGLLLSICTPVGALAAPDSFFDIFIEVPLSGPPYPTPPVMATLSTSASAAGAFEQLSMTLMRYDHGDPGTPMAGHVLGHDSGGGVGQYGIDSFFDVFMDMPLMGPMPPAIFDIKVQDQLLATSQTSQLVARHPELPVDDPARYFDVTRVSSFFDIFCTCNNGYGLIDYRFHGFKGLCDCSFQDVHVNLNPAPYADSFFDIFVEVSCLGMDEPANPCWSVQTTATYTQFPVAIQPATWSGVKSMYAR